MGKSMLSLFFRGFRQGIFVGKLLEKLCKLLVVLALNSVKIAVIFKAVVIYLNEIYGNVGAVVGNSLKVGEKVGENEALLNGTGLSSEPFHVTGFHFGAEIIHHLFERLHLVCKVDILCLKRLNGNVKYLFDSTEHNIQLTLRHGGEADFLGVYLSGSVKNVHRMVGNALKIAYGM